MGEPVPRVDARLKVTGAARYPADTIERLDLDDARSLAGVLDILTSENTSELKPAKFGQGSATSIQTLGPQIDHAGQIVAIVVADTFEAASEAAHRVKVSYAEEKPAATFGAVGLTERCYQGFPAAQAFAGSRQCGRGDCRRRCSDRRRIFHANPASQPDRIVRHHLRVDRG